MPKTDCTLKVDHKKTPFKTIPILTKKVHCGAFLEGDLQRERKNMIFGKIIVAATYIAGVLMAARYGKETVKGIIGLYRDFFQDLKEML